MARVIDIFTPVNGISVTEMDVADIKTESNSLLLIRPSKTALGTICGYVCEEDIPSNKIMEANTLFVSTNGEGSHTFSYVSAEKFTMNSDVVALLPKKN